MPVRVVVAVGPLLQREGLCAMLAAFPEFEVATAADAARLTEAEADVVITTADGSLPSKSPVPGVIVVGAEPIPGVARALFESGVASNGYLLYDELTSNDVLATAIRNVAAGRSAISPRVAVEMRKRQSAEGESPIAGLTRRQTAVLAEMASGKSNAAIATTLGITKRAVERHIGAIYPKLGLQHDEGASPRVAASLLYLRATLGR